MQSSETGSVVLQVTANGLGKLAKCKTLQAIALGRDPDLAPEEGGLDYDSKVSALPDLNG